MLPFTADTLRLSLHVLAAAVWVGGQLAVAALVPALRRAGEGVPGVAARRFAALAWPAFAVLVLTGVWNVVDVQVGDTSTAYQVTLFVKLLVVLVAGVAAALHSRARSKAAVAAWGGVGGVASVAALVLGVLLHG
jgi:putative copper export protein